MSKVRSLARETSGYRSEVLMKFRPFLLFAFIAIFSLGIFAQSNLKPNRLTVRTDAGGSALSAGVSRSRVVRANVSRGSETNSAVLELEKDTFQLLNVERALKGLPALKWNENVAKVARLHSRNMADQNFFSHKGADGSMVDDRADKLGLGEWRAIGENIAYLKGFQNPVEIAVEKWMQSTSHRQNLLSAKWSDSAVGVAVTADGRYYFTQVFLLRK